jgi:hypothetical protein
MGSVRCARGRLQEVERDYQINDSLPAMKVCRYGRAIKKIEFHNDSGGVRLLS